MSTSTSVLVTLLLALTAAAAPDSGGNFATQSNFVPASNVGADAGHLPHRGDGVSLPSSSQELQRLASMLLALLGQIIDEAMSNVFPLVSRVRRAASEEERGYLDSLVVGMGAFMDRQDCRSRVTCSAGKSLQYNIPGSQVLITLLETFVPPSWLGRYSTLKRSVIDRRDNCSEEYRCQLLNQD